VKKMSQSLGNYISVRDEPEDMFGKVMSIPDDAMPDWYRLAAMATRSEVEALEQGIADGTVHPGEAKRELGRRVVAIHHDTQAAQSAEAVFDRLFRAHEAPDDVPVHAISAEGEVSLPAVLADADLVASRSEGRRMIKQGAVRIAGERTDSEFVDVSLIKDSVIQVGKRRFVRIEIA
jgi:tyrosyl-tRNA synthetase